MNTRSDGFLPERTTPTEQPRKTPADFQAEAEQMNAALDLLMNERANLERRFADHAKNRETLIGNAALFGVTARYGRALLRKG